VGASLDEFASRSKSFNWTDYTDCPPHGIDEWLRINDKAMVTVIDSIAVSEIDEAGFKPRHRIEAISCASGLLCQGCRVGQFVLGTISSTANYTTEDTGLRSNARALILKHTEYDSADVSAALDGPVLEAFDQLARKNTIAGKVMNEDESTLWQLGLLTEGIRLALAEEDLFHLRGRT